MNVELEDWINSRPIHVQKVIRKYPPDKKYKIAEDNIKTCHIISYDESERLDSEGLPIVTMKVEIIPSAIFPFEYVVFGVEHLIECEDD